MPRGKKMISPQEQLAAVTQEIADLTERLASAKKLKKALEQQLKQVELETLYTAIQSSGKSMREVMDFIGK